MTQLEGIKSTGGTLTHRVVPREISSIVGVVRPGECHLVAVVEQRHRTGGIQQSPCDPNPRVGLWLLDRHRKRVTTEIGEATTDSSVLRRS